ncbi:MAG: CopG family transcriptional regulator [Candidatus Aminicenantes bacterium]|nr:CopG family transcriptional regulator [Candidatus Aminicenantes bacterium]
MREEKNKGRNVTLYLSRNLIQKAKVMAVKEDKSLSAFMREALEEKVTKDTGYKKARKRQIKLLEKGFDLGTQGKISISRDRLHERK